MIGVVVVYAAAIACAAAMGGHPVVAVAVAFDLSITSAAVFWLLAVRPGHARPAALIRVVFVGLALARLVVGVRALGVVGIAIELCVLVLLVMRVRRLVRRMRVERRAGHGLTAALEVALGDVLPVPALASVLAVEISAVILAVTGWFRTAPAGFSMHRRSAYLTILGVIVALVIIEGVGTHLVLSRVSSTAAIVTSALTLYGLVWIVGAAHAARLSPARFVAAGLVIERGVRSRVVVPLDRIAVAAPIAGPVSDAIDLSFHGANVLLTLHEPVAVHGLFGRSRYTAKLALSLDDRDGFLSHLASASRTLPR